MAERRQQVLSALRASESPMSILEIARQLGLHVNTVRFHLQVLTDSGRVELVERTRNSPGRPPLMFRAKRGMDPGGPRNYQDLADALATRLASEYKPTSKALEAGREWGHGLGTARLAAGFSARAALTSDEATDQLVGILGELGFSPHLRSLGGGVQIGLRHCPFLDLVPKHQEVICPVHLGLMQGAMESMSAKVTVERLEAFAEPDLCLAHLGSTSAAS